MNDISKFLCDTKVLDVLMDLWFLQTKIEYLLSCSNVRDDFLDLTNANIAVSDALNSIISYVKNLE